MKKKQVGEEIASVVGRKRPRAAKLAAVAPKRPLPPPSSDDARTELKRLVQQHKAWTRKAVSIQLMSSDRTDRTTGDIIECDVPMAVRAQMSLVVDSLKAESTRLEAAMQRTLRGIPIYQHFLKHVFGCGPVVAAYLVADVDIRKAVKISNLRRYCGLAVINGSLERRSGAPKAIGGTGTYNAEIRTRLFQMFSAMWKNAAKSGKTSKYLRIWTDYKHRMQHSERLVDAAVNPKDGLVDGKIVNGSGKTVSARGHINSTGWHKAADVFVEDLYVIWRALEGLEVWPSYYTAKLSGGFEHGGAPAKTIGPRMLTLEEALAVVGDPRGIVVKASAAE